MTRLAKILILAVATLAIATADASLPAGFSGNVLYVLVIVALARWDIIAPYTAAAIFSAASIAGSLLAPRFVPQSVELADRAVTITVLWICAALVSELQRQRRRAEEARALAEQINRRKSRFLAAASHDLRQPAQSLVLLTAVLKARAVNTPLQQLVEPLGNAVDALTSLLSSLLEVSRLEAGIIRRQSMLVDVSNLARRLEREDGLTAVERGLRFKVVCRPGMTLRTDPHMLERILRNLLDNAFKYTNRGGVLLYCRKTPGGMRFDVADTGIGIAEADLPNIFEEFLQLDNEARDRAKGLGLGLAVVQRLVNMLGGTIQVRSRQGAGSLFSVRLPELIDGTAERAPTDVSWPEVGCPPAA